MKGPELAAFANLRHRKLDAETRQPLSAARVLIEQGGWELDTRKDRNTDDAIAALEGAKSGYVGGDAGSKAEGGEQPAAPSGRAPQPETTPEG